MSEPNELIWISPVLSQSETETLFQWINFHLGQARLKTLSSFSQTRIDFILEPKEALKLHFEVTPEGVKNALELFKEAVWSEILAGSQPTPFVLSLQSKSQLSTPKKLACFDMDSTLINEEVIDEIARNAGFYDQVSKITEAAMQGHLDFKESLKERVKLFKGMPQAEVMAMIQALSLSAGAEKLLSRLRSKSIRTAVVSGGFQMILNHFQKMLFLDHSYGNTLKVDDEERLVGEVEDPIVDASFKRAQVSALKKKYSASLAETIAVGDGANDIPMMSEAGVSVSFCGKPKLAAHVNTLILDRNLLWLMHLI